MASRRTAQPTTAGARAWPHPPGRSRQRGLRRLVRGGQHVADGHWTVGDACDSYTARTSASARSPSARPTFGAVPAARRRRSRGTGARVRCCRGGRITRCPAGPADPASASRSSRLCTRRVRPSSPCGGRGDEVRQPVVDDDRVALVPHHLDLRAGRPDCRPWWRASWRARRREPHEWRRATSSTSMRSWADVAVHANTSVGSPRNQVSRSTVCTPWFISGATTVERPGAPPRAGVVVLLAPPPRDASPARRPRGRTGPRRSPTGSPGCRDRSGAG